MHFIRAFLFLCLSLHLGLVIVAQHPIRSSSIAADYLSWHDAQLGVEKSGIINGEYIEVKRISKETHQFFVTDQWTAGTLMFRGQLFDSIYLTYDLERDLILMRHPTDYRYHSQAIKPIQSDISHFQLHDAYFQWYGGPESGFYETLYESPEISLVAKRQKKVKVESQITFEQDDRFYLIYNKDFYRVTRKASFIKIFKAHKKEMKSFIKTKNLTIVPGHDEQMIELTQFIHQSILTR